jgi:hypothetical protein
MIRFQYLVVISLLLVGLAACGGKEPATAGVDTAFANACDESNEGERVAVTGYLRLPDSFSGDVSAVLRLFETDSFEGTPIGATAKLGTEPNQMESVPASYTDNDLKVHLSDGQVVGYDTKVKVSGKMYYPLVDQDFVCGLENLLIEPAN